MTIRMEKLIKGTVCIQVKRQQSSAPRLEMKSIKAGLAKHRFLELIGNTLMLGKTEGRRSGHQRMRQLDGISDSMDMNSSKLGDAEGQGNLTAS